MSVERLARIELNSTDPDRLAGFYERALGFSRTGERELPTEATSRLFGLPLQGARAVSLRLGAQRLDLVGFTPAGAPYPGDVPGWSPLFQHCAIIVSDMAAAHARLSGEAGWRPISQGGPQELPKSSGGVTAFKFRDPEGHPLELLAFPAGAVPEIWQHPAGKPFLGIDHSAISVAHTARSVRFYEGLGFAVSSRSHNVGPEQSRMDAVAEADVAVTGLSLPGETAPHLELLCYDSHGERVTTRVHAGDGVATRLVLAMRGTGEVAAACEAMADRLVSPGPVAWPDGRVEALLRDPDGHHIVLTARD